MDPDPSDKPDLSGMELTLTQATSRHGVCSGNSSVRPRRLTERTTAMAARELWSAKVVDSRSGTDRLRLLTGSTEPAAGTGPGLLLGSAVKSTG